MNPYGHAYQYAYPTSQPQYPHPTSPSQYIHSPASPNGYYHFYPLPQHHHPPGVPFVPIPPHMLNHHPPPPQNHLTNTNGWHGLGNGSPNAPLHPPGLNVPIHTHQGSSPAPDERPHLPDIFPHSLAIHEYWRGRLAPFPGFSSRPTLLPMKERKQQETQKSETSIIASSSSLETRSANSPITPLKTTKNGEKTEKSKKDFQFDTYADAFVPQHLYNIQRETHTLIPLPPIPVFPSVSYLQSFLLPPLIDESHKSDNFSLLNAPPIPKDSKTPLLDHSTYHNHWTEILRWELDAIAEKKEGIVLWKLGLKVVLWKDSEFVLFVPGIRENHPYLEVGDLVHMREVTMHENRRQALEGRVVALRKREGLIHIHSLPLRAYIQMYVKLTLQTIKTENGYVVLEPDDPVPFNFNVSFMTNAQPLCLMEAAVAAVSNVLTSAELGTNLARQWIFPDPEDFANGPSVMLLNGEIKKDQWVDQGLNEEQRLAVTLISLYQSPVPRLISGPPGTGKTRTVVEAVLQIFRVQPEACILLCAPSNPATDTLALRLQHHLLQHEMLRLNDPNRTFAEVPDSIKPYCYVENAKFSIPPWKALMRFRVVVTSCLDAGILVGAHCTNTQLMAMEDEVATSIHPHRKPKHVVQPHWTHLLIDEAAQGSEPELLIPISVVLPQVYNEEVKGKTFMPQLALCGDINQLGPIVASDEARSAELEVSLLERLFERPLYSTYVPESPSVHRPWPYTKLVKNYRSHPAILMPPSAIFYNDTLQPCARNGKISWPGLPNPRLPLKFIGTEALEKSTDEKASWFNPGQINIIVAIIKSLLEDPRASDPPLRPGDISVMAPWRKQVWMTRKRLRNEGFSAVDVGSVEDYQGRESRVVIISCVRSSPRFLEEDHKKGLGLMFERKRMNVAITRAKELMVVVGNGALLQRDPYWKSFLQFALRNGLYQGPELSLEMDGNYVSRLESKLAQLGEETKDLDPEALGLLLAGGVAREVLRE